MRLQRYMAQCGVAARRKCEEWIEAGRVSVNGVVVTTPGTRVTPEDVVSVDGKPIRPEAQKRYILYHKPMGEVTSVRDQYGRPTVLDRFADMPERIYPVGRLDYDSEGLLLLTNDGALAQRMLHPRNEVEKEYLVRVRGRVDLAAIRRLREGVPIGANKTAPAKVRVIRQTDLDTTLLIVIHEGRNRQVRRMFEAVGCSVLLLRRVRFGPLQLSGLRRGEWRPLTDAEIAQLNRL